MSKLSFRARALDASKPMPVFMAEELPDLPDYSAINRAVPQMPSGMEKEEECEHHLQRAICAGLIIPTPEVTTMDEEAYQKLYPANYKQPRQLIHMQPFTMEQDIIDYDMDTDDETWLTSQTPRLELTLLKFEEMMDKLEKSSGQTVVTLNEAKALLKEDDDLIIAVYDYWLNKRWKTQHPLILHVKTEHRPGTANNNPYIAFRRRTEKMQTRKNRKNDETSYEKMLKLRRDLSRAVTLLELIKRREKMKREYAHLTLEVFEKRYQSKDFSGAVVAELSALKSRPAFTPIFHNHYTNQGWSNKAILKDEIIQRKEKRQYKKRKHKSSNHHRLSIGSSGVDLGNLSSDEEPLPQASPEPEEIEDEGQFAFRRNKLCSYHMPQKTEGNWPWCSKDENGTADKKYRYSLTSLAHPRRCIGFARRRMGRGGRIILDRVANGLDDFWRSVDFTIYETESVKVKDEPSADFSTNLFTNLDISSSANSLKAVVKTESGDRSRDSSLRTSMSEINSESGFSMIKQEPEEIVEEWSVPVESTAPTAAAATQQQSEMLEFLEEIRRDWLHFRPKTPPPDYEPPCSMLPSDDDIFVPSANAPFSLEIQTLEAPSALLDTSTFVTSPFTLDDLCALADVPVTDTRQSGSGDLQTGLNLNVNVGLNTLTPSDGLSVSLENCLVASPSCESESRTIGCSVFNVSDVKMSESAVLEASAGQQLNSKIKSEVPASSANGLLSQFGFDVSSNDKVKNNRNHSYAYRGGIESYGAGSGTFNIHTSAHTLNTLNSHSANILEIPLSSDSNPISHRKPCTEAATPPPNSKNKAIVQKNSLVMEVT